MNERNAVPMRDFSQSLPMALMRAREAVMRGFRPSLGAHGLSEQQFRVLRALTAVAGPVEFGELAERTCLLGPSLSRIVSNLEARGLLVRTADLHDARRASIAVTSAGTALVAEIAPESERQYQDIELALGSERLEMLYTLLDELACIPVEAAPQRPA